MLASLKAWEQKCKELEKKCDEMQEDSEGKTKERIANQQSKYKELKMVLDKVIKTLNIDSDVSMHTCMFIDGI